MTKATMPQGTATPIPRLQAALMPNAAAPVDFLLPRKQVEKQSGYSRASLYRLIKAGKFPAPYSLSTGAVRWKQSDITAWKSSLTKTS